MFILTGGGGLIQYLFASFENGHIAADQVNFSFIKNQRYFKMNILLLLQF